MVFEQLYQWAKRGVLFLSGQKIEIWGGGPGNNSPSTEHEILNRNLLTRALQHYNTIPHRWRIRGHRPMVKSYGQIGLGPMSFSYGQTPIKLTPFKTRNSLVLQRLPVSVRGGKKATKRECKKIVVHGQAGMVFSYGVNRTN